MNKKSIFNSNTGLKTHTLNQYLQQRVMSPEGIAGQLYLFFSIQEASIKRLKY